MIQLRISPPPRDLLEGFVHHFRSSCTSDTSLWVYGKPWWPAGRRCPSPNPSVSAVASPELRRPFAAVPFTPAPEFASLPPLSRLRRPWSLLRWSRWTTAVSPSCSSSFAFFPSAVRFGHDCAVAMPSPGVTLAKRPLILGRLSASVLRHSYRIFLCPRCRARRFARYLCSCALSQRARRERSRQRRLHLRIHGRDVARRRFVASDVEL